MLWKIVPVASASDPRWLDRPIWKRLIVRAESPMQAIQQATAWEEPVGATSVGNESGSHASGFSDEKLYTVTALTREEADCLTPGDDGRHGVILAEPQEPGTAEPVHPLAV